LASELYDIKGARAYHQGELPDNTALGIHVLSDRTLAVELEAPVNYFLNVLANAVAFAVPSKAIEAHGEAWAEPEYIVTSGPFRLKNWVRGKAMTLERSRGSSGWLAGNAAQLEIQLYTGDASHLLAEYENDHLDILILHELTLDQLELARQRLAADYISVPVLSTWFVYFDHRIPPFSDSSRNGSPSREASSLSVSGI